MNKKNLGRGLSSLLSEANLDLNDEVSLDASESSFEGKSFTIIPIEKITNATKFFA